MKISASTLAFLLEISKKDANNKIIACIERQAGNTADMLESTIMTIPHPKKEGVFISKYSKNESIDLEILEKYLNLPLSFAIKNIRDRSLRSKTTSDRIQNYPATKIKPDKDTGKLPLTVKVPDYYKVLLPAEDLDKILDLWKSTYPAFIRQGGTFTL